jgi:antitoxin ParD1/3/4
MVIHLSKEREQMVRSLMQDGRFTSEDAVIGEALRLLEEREEQDRLAELRRQVAIGIEQADRGELVLLDPHATLQRVSSRHASSARGS